MQFSMDLCEWIFSSVVCEWLNLCNRYAPNQRIVKWPKKKLFGNRKSASFIASKILIFFSVFCITRIVKVVNRSELLLLCLPFVFLMLETEWKRDGLNWIQIKNWRHAHKLRAPKKVKNWFLVTTYTQFSHLCISAGTICVVYIRALALSRTAAISIHIVENCKAISLGPC